MDCMECINRVDAGSDTGAAPPKRVFSCAAYHAGSIRAEALSYSAVGQDETAAAPVYEGKANVEQGILNIEVKNKTSSFLALYHSLSKTEE